jgi:Bacterial SH3 domain
MRHLKLAPPFNVVFSPKAAKQPVRPAPPAPAQDRHAQDRHAQDRHAQDRHAHERHAHDRDAHERSLREREARERDARQRTLRERDLRERAEDARLAAIAQRFAPDARPMDDAIVSPPAFPDAASQARPRPRELRRHKRSALGNPIGAFKALPPAFQGLILALVLIALLPSLTLTALVWLGPADPFGPAPSSGKTFPVKTASLVDLPIVAGDPPPPAGPAPDIADTGIASLAAPARIEAQAGREVPFAIALASVDPLPIRSVVAVSGLPDGATMTAGRPYGAGEWNLRLDELDGLRLVLPNTAQGETSLEVALIDSDGTTLAEAETTLNVTASPAQIAGTQGAAPAAQTASSFDPFAAPSFADAATVPKGFVVDDQASKTPAPETPAPETPAPETPAPQTQAPQAQASEPQVPAMPVSETQASEAQASEPAPEPVAATEPDESTSEPATESESVAAAEPASEPESVAAAEPTAAPTRGPASAPDIIEPATSPSSGPFADTGAKTAPSVALSDFVNLRASPTSSARVIAVVAKGAQVTPTAKKRGWLQVTDPATGKTGWIYGRYAGGTATRASSGVARTAERLGPSSSTSSSSSDDSFWTRMGRWLVY